MYPPKPSGSSAAYLWAHRNCPSRARALATTRDSFASSNEDGTLFVACHESRPVATCSSSEPTPLSLPPSPPFESRPRAACNALLERCAGGSVVTRWRMTNKWCAPAQKPTIARLAYAQVCRSLSRGSRALFASTRAQTACGSPVLDILWERKTASSCGPPAAARPPRAKRFRSSGEGGGAIYSGRTAPTIVVSYFN